MHPGGKADAATCKRAEAAAHFATLYVQDTYPKAVAFMARECPILTMSMVLYVKNIGVK